MEERVCELTHPSLHNSSVPEQEIESGAVFTRPWFRIHLHGGEVEWSCRLGTGLRARRSRF